MRRVYIIKTTKTKGKNRVGLGPPAAMAGRDDGPKVKSEPGGNGRKSCMVQGCYSQSGKVEVFSVPSNESKREKWLENIRFRKRPGRAPKNTYVCKIHFEPRCLIPDSAGRCRSRLKKRSVPTLNLDLLGQSGGDDSFVVHPCGVEEDRDAATAGNAEPFLKEHNYSSNVARSPEILARDLKKARKNIEALQQEVGCLRRGLFRWRKNAKRLNNLDLKMKRLFPLEDLEKESTKDRLELVSALTFREKKRKFPPKVKEMAMNVFFHSPSCYMYLKGQFHLPSVCLIRKWLNDHQKTGEDDDKEDIVKEEIISEDEIKK